MSTLGKLGVAVAVMIATAALLVGCGDDDSPSTAGGGYCSDVQDAKDSFEGLLNNQIDQSTFDNLRDQLHAISAEAPTSIKTEWVIVAKALDRFGAAMAEAGLTMEDMRDMGSGSMAGGKPMERAMAAAASLGAASFSTAQSTIARSVQSECHFSLS